MQTREQLIVPVLGVVIILATFILGVPLIYKVLLGILGLAAAGTYFAPHQVQVETRVAIAAVGLIILLMVTSTAFWLTLLSFGAIAALQFQHRDALRRNPATIAWLSTVLKRAQARRSGRAEAAGDADEETGAVAAAGDGEGRPSAPALVGTLPGFVRVNAAGIGGLVVGVIVLGSVFMPWFAFLISVQGEAAGFNFTLRTASREFELSAFGMFFYALSALGLLSIISIVLPRVVAIIIAGAGLAVTLASYLYVVGLLENEAAELSDIGVGATAIPAIGALIAGVAFLVMLVLQLIPGANRSAGAG